MMSYHLRRLRLHGLIDHIPHTHGYEVGDFGPAVAVFLTRPTPASPGPPSAISSEPGCRPRSARPFERVDIELDRLAHHSRLIA